MSNFYFDFESDSEEKNGLIWKTILRTGRWNYRPGPLGRPIKTPLIVKRGDVINRDSEISLDEIVAAFSENAIEHVTIPKSHKNLVDENTGYVKELSIVPDPKRPGEFLLLGGMSITEPDIKEKILNKSIANVSCKLRPALDREEGRSWPVALEHVCLTNQPWINGMDAFSENEDSEEEEFILEFNHPESEPDSKNLSSFLKDFKSDILEILKMSKETTTNTQLSYNNNSESGKAANPQILSGGKTRMKFQELGALELSQEQADTIEKLIADKAAEAVSSARGEFEVQLSETKDSLAGVTAELETYRAADSKNKVESRIEELSTMGFSEYPGFLKKAREIMLADNGESTLELSTDGNTVSLSATDIINTLVESLPFDDEGKLQLSQQAELTAGEQGKPPVEVNDKKGSVADRSATAKEFLGIK